MEFKFSVVCMSATLRPPGEVTYCFHDAASYFEGIPPTDRVEVELNVQTAGFQVGKQYTFTLGEKK